MTTAGDSRVGASATNSRGGGIVLHARLAQTVLDVARMRSFDGSLDIIGAVVEQLAHDEARRMRLIRVLRDSGGHMNRAAERLGVDRTSLYRILRRHGLNPADYRTTRSEVATNALRNLKLR